MNTPLIIGALVVAVLIVLWLINVIKTTIQTALIVGVVVFALQLGFKVGPLDLWQQIQVAVGGIAKWLRQWGNKYKPPKDTPETILWFTLTLLEYVS